MSEHHEHFYGKAILAHQEQEYIQTLIKRFKGLSATEELRAQVHDLLAEETAKGNLSIPFKVILRKDSSGKFPPSIEVILDTKL